MIKEEEEQDIYSEKKEETNKQKKVRLYFYSCFSIFEQDIKKSHHKKQLQRAF
jgi:hypothetical protein